MFTRIGDNLFGFLRFLAVLCGIAGLILAFTSGFAVAWPWLRASALCAMPVAAPAFFAKLFAAIEHKRNTRTDQ